MIDINNLTKLAEMFIRRIEDPLNRIAGNSDRMAEDTTRIAEDTARIADHLTSSREKRKNIEKISNPNQISSRVNHFLTTVTLKEIHNTRTPLRPSKIVFDEDLLNLPIGKILEKNVKDISFNVHGKPYQSLGEVGLSSLASRTMECYRQQQTGSLDLELRELGKHIVNSPLMESAQKIPKEFKTQLEEGCVRGRI
jgi:hypothetical protein